MFIQKFNYRSKPEIKKENPSRNVISYILKNNPWAEFKKNWESKFGSIENGPRAVLFIPKYLFKDYHPREINLFLVWYERPQATILTIFENFFKSSTNYYLFFIREHECYAINCKKKTDYIHKKKILMKKLKKGYNSQNSDFYLSLKTPIPFNKNLRQLLINGYQTKDQKQLSNASTLDIDISTYIVKILKNGIENYKILLDNNRFEKIQEDNLLEEINRFSENQKLSTCFYKTLRNKKTNIEIYQIGGRKFLDITIPIPVTFFLDNLLLTELLFRLNLFQIPLCSPFRLGLGMINSFFNK